MNASDVLQHAQENGLTMVEALASLRLNEQLKTIELAQSWEDLKPVLIYLVMQHERRR